MDVEWFINGPKGLFENYKRSRSENRKGIISFLLAEGFLTFLGTSHIVNIYINSYIK